MNKVRPVYKLFTSKGELIDEQFNEFADTHTDVRAVKVEYNADYENSSIIACFLPAEDVGLTKYNVNVYEIWGDDTEGESKQESAVRQLNNWLANNMELNIVELIYRIDPSDKFANILVIYRVSIE